MNQTKKRLSIIELAISITDIEAIKLQMLRLQPLRSDEDIHHILTLLEEENYVQAQEYIRIYIENPTQTVIQRIPQEEQEIINEFPFLEVKTDEKKDIVESMSDVTTEVTIEKKENLEPILDTETHTISSDVNTIDAYATDYAKEKIDFNLQNVPKDNFFDSVAKSDSKASTEISVQTPIEDTSTIETPDTDGIVDNQIEETESLADILEDITTPTLESMNPPIEELTHKHSTANTENEMIHYNAIENIEEKIETIHQQYPVIYTLEERSEEIQYWITKLSTKGYNEVDIKEILKRTETLATTDKAEAAELLLVTSVTQSPYALFILARALYKGSLLQRNLDEAFTIMSKLAYKDKFAEALCDLGQFYENGVAVDKDKKQAKILYREAMYLGVDRAEKHYQRLENEGKGFFSFLKR